jgi:CBS domain containing-hemolysin-like protein
LNPENKTTWLRKTNQRWKIVLFCFAMVITAVLFFGGDYAPKSLAAHLPKDIVLILYGTALGVVALLWIGFSIRCPACRKNIGGYMISTFDWRVWFTTLVSMESCPRCGK